jgi:hypothetical protein
MLITQKIVDKYLKDTEIVLTNKQMETLNIILNNNYKEIFCWGSTRSGRTYIIFICLIILCLEYSNLNILIIHPKFYVAKTALIEMLMLYILDKMKVKYNFDKLNCLIEINNSRIKIFGLDNDINYILQQRYNIIYMDRILQVEEKDRNIIRNQLERRNENINNFIIYDDNPGFIYKPIYDKKDDEIKLKMNYLYKEFYIDKNEDNILIKFSIKDNISNLPDNYIEYIGEQLKKNDKNKYKKFILGEWINKEINKC